MDEQHRTRLTGAVRELTPELSRRAEEIEAARELPADLLDGLRAAGCFRMFVPRSHGGYEADPHTGLAVLEELARADGSTGWTVMIGAETPHLLALLPRDRFDKFYASGPDVVVAGGFAPQGRAELADGGFQVTGRWGSSAAPGTPTGSSATACSPGTASRCPARTASPWRYVRCCCPPTR